jgi:hypothetical protein
MRILIALVTATVLLAGCGDDAGRDVTRINKGRSAVIDKAAQGAPATITRRLDFAACLADEEAQSTRCPTFALLSLDYLSGQCAASGGKLEARVPSEAWSLDVDGDASAEVLVDLVNNFDCVGVPGVFACGSTGCPFLLYKKRGETWVELGAINADDGPGIQVLKSEEGKYAELVGGCSGKQPCSEYTHYAWNGRAYARTWIDFKDHPVDVASGGIMTLTQDSAVIDAPGAKGQVIEEYPIGTAMIVIGAAREGPYSFVSPCNACRRGFVETALLRKQG